jgi:hypothetical protein
MSAEMSEDDAGPAAAGDWPLQDGASMAESLHSDNEMEDNPNGSADPSTQPIQKRRRVTRACDECRRKKIKCDGKQPCTHCSVYSYECTYDKPSNRRRNPAPQYIEALEGRLQRAEALLRQVMPDVDLADPNLDPAVQQEFRNREQARSRNSAAQSTAPGRPSQASTSSSQDGQLLSMIDSVGQLEIDERGGWDFHGISSGAVFLRRMKDHFRGMLGPSTKAPFMPREPPTGIATLDSPSPSSVSVFSSQSIHPELPPKEVAKSLCYYSLSCATCLVRIVHVPTFYQMLDRIYEKPLDNLTIEESHFLGLLFSVLALGCMYNNLDNSVADKVVYNVSLEEGLKFYRTARSLLQDITDCRDLISLQALLFMILFLQATANLSACYSFVGIALRSALRIGLHRHLQHEQIDPVEQETRTRVFYVIRQMDIYVSTLLGFPLLLNSDDIDQPFPLEIDDEFITPSGIMQPPHGAPSYFQAFNAHTRLMEILAKITKHVYPMRGMAKAANDQPKPAYLISYSRIKEIEADLHSWYERLPEAWRPHPDGPVEVVRVRHLLRFAYAHVQLVLYRPFLHYVSPRLSQGNKIDELSYACAAAAISVSRNIVHIGLEIRKQQVVSGPYWFMLYTEFFAVLSLVFYAIENPEKPGAVEVLADAHAGKQMITDLADKSLSADRVSKALEALFEQLPEPLRQARPRPGASKKRTAPNTNHGNGTAQFPGISQGAPGLTPDALKGSHSSMSTPMFGNQAPRASVDSMHPSTTDSMFMDTSFSSSLQDFFPFEMSSRATPESTSTAGSSQRATFASQSVQGANPMNKLDSLMFPSEDPFAYPNQPMMELGFPSKSDGGAASLAGQGQDPQFFYPGTMEEIDSQFLGQPPPYMMQNQQGHGMMGSMQNMFDPSSAMLGFQQGIQAHRANSTPTLTHHPAQRPPQHHHAPASMGGTPSLSQRRPRGQRRQERRIDQMFTQQGMQADWGGFFGSGRGGFQGM